MCWCCVCRLFVKQKSAYEMRISDWSSDVCSADLNVSRRAGTSIAQVTALGLGLMALLLLTFVRTDLLDRWQLSLAQDAPNRFIINVQSDQAQPVRDFIAAQVLAAPTLVPLVLARLLDSNAKPMRGDPQAPREHGKGS